MKKLLFLLGTLLGIISLHGMKHSPEFFTDEYNNNVISIDESIFERDVISLFNKQHATTNNSLSGLIAQRIVLFWCDPIFCAKRAHELGYETLHSVEEHTIYFDELFAEVFENNFFIELHLPLKNEKSLFLIALQHNREDIFLRLVAYDDEYKSKKDAKHLSALYPDEENEETGMRLIHYASMYGQQKALSQLKTLGANLTVRARVHSVFPNCSAARIIERSQHIKNDEQRSELLAILGDEACNVRDDIQLHLIQTELARLNSSQADSQRLLIHSILSWASNTSLDETSPSPTQDFSAEISLPNQAVSTNSCATQNKASEESALRAIRIGDNDEKHATSDSHIPQSSSNRCCLVQ